MIKGKSFSAAVLASLLIVGTVSGCKRSPKSWLDFWSNDSSKNAASPSDISLPPPPISSNLPGSESVLPDIGAIPEAPPETAAPTPGELSLAEPPRGEPKAEVADLQTVYFNFDSARLTDQAARTLDANAQWLRQHPGLDVQLEGHCDEQGTREYNLALGMRRAEAAREYLVSQGVDPNRLSVTSYGEERPAVLGHTEEAYAKNRRVQFFIFR